MDLSSVSKYFSNAARRVTEMSSDASLMFAAGRLAEYVSDALRSGNKVMFAGNGGFAALSQHAAAELVGRMRRTRCAAAAVSLAVDAAVITCIANDFGFRKLFSRQLEALGNQGDLVVAMSASGSSSDILELFAAAERLGIRSVLITGSEAPEYATLLSAETIRVPAAKAAEVQDLASILIHAVCESVEAGLQDEARRKAWSGILSLPDRVEYLLIDRDGVMNRLIPDGYVCNCDQLDAAQDFLDIAHSLAERFRRILVVTNQRGVSKGLMSRDDLCLIEEKLSAEVAGEGGRIDGFYTATGENSEEVKPETGLWDKIRRDNPELNGENTVMVGDSAGDRLFARKAGLIFIEMPTLC